MSDAKTINDIRPATVRPDSESPSKGTMGYRVTLSR